MTAPTLVRLGDGLAYESIPGVFAAVRPACPHLALAPEPGW